MINVLDGRTSIYTWGFWSLGSIISLKRKAFLHHLKWEFWAEKNQSSRRNLCRNSWRQWLEVRYFVSALVLLCFYYNDLETQVGFIKISYIWYQSRMTSALIWKSFHFYAMKMNWFWFLLGNLLIYFVENHEEISFSTFLVGKMLILCMHI